MKIPVADPGVGRDDAPIGSEDWAKRVRLHMQSTVNDLDMRPDSLRGYTDLIRRHDAWKLMNKPDGSFFGSFEEFCEFRQPWGLGHKWEKLAPFVGALNWLKGKPGDPRPAEISAPAPLAAAESIPIAKIVTDGGTQPRASIDDAVVEDYAEKLSAGAEFPPVVVFFDGTRYWLADGFHRVAAAIKAGRSEIAADVRQGDRSEAIWFSCGANATHGKQRLPGDVTRAIKTALGHPKSEGMSARQVAAHCGAGKTLVAEIMAQPSAPDSCRQPRKGADGKTRPASQPASREKKKTRENKRAAGAAGGRAKAANRAAAKAAEQAPSSTADENESGLNFAPAPTDAKPANPYSQGPGAAEIYVPAPAPKQSAPAPSYDQVMAMLEPGLRAAESLPPQQRESIVRLVASRLMPDLS